jgi:hypothetical protein
MEWFPGPTMTDAAADLTTDLDSTSHGSLGVLKRDDRADALRMGEAKIGICEDEDRNGFRYANSI